jgi:cytochrome c biogenesis protein
MKLLKIQKSFKILTDLKFAILILGLLALGSSLGSFIEQEESIQFYEENYANKIYGIIDSKLILTFGLDHVYTTWWFLSLLILLATSLISLRQFPLLLENSKEYFFKKKGTSFLILPFSVKLKNLYYLPELLLLKIQELKFTYTKTECDIKV